MGQNRKKVSDLTNYYDKTTVDEKIDAIPKPDLTNYLTKTGDGSNLTAAFEEATTLEELTTGEKLSSILGKIKLAVKNLKSLIGLIGTTDISTIGDGTITGGLSDVNGKLGNFYLLYSHLCGTAGNSIWRQNPQFPEEYYAQYTVPEKEGYRFFFSFWQISWTNNNEYCNYLIRNPFLHEKNGNIEVYSKDGTPTFVPVFLCIYLPV